MKTMILYFEKGKIFEKKEFSCVRNVYWENGELYARVNGTISRVAEFNYGEFRVIK